MAFTAQQVQAALEELLDPEFNKYGERNFHKVIHYSYPQEFDLSIGKVEVVDSKWGAEGGGEDIWYILSVNGQLFRQSGYYSSYDGENWEGMFEEVTRTPKTIYVYDKKA
jgi:hypothetical protein